MCYNTEVTGRDLEAVRAVMDEVYQYVNEDVSERVKSSWGENGLPPTKNSTNTGASTQQQA